MFQPSSSYIFYVAVVVIHVLGHQSGSQPETKDEILQRRDAVDLMMRFNELFKDRLPVLVKLLRELAIETGDTVRRPFQFRIGCDLLRTGGDVAVV